MIADEGLNNNENFRYLSDNNGIEAARNQGKEGRKNSSADKITDSHLRNIIVTIQQLKNFEKWKG